MHYVFSQCIPTGEGAFSIPPGLVRHWARQMDTPYEELSEREKESDREQADKVLAVLDEVEDIVMSS